MKSARSITNVMRGKPLRFPLAIFFYLILGYNVNVSLIRAFYHFENITQKGTLKCSF